MKVKVLRAFLVKGEAQAVGAEIELPDRLAAELIHVGKVEPAAAGKPAAKAPMKSAASPLVAGAAPQQEKSA